MGSCEEAKDCESEETSSPPPQQNGHLYHEWAAVQAYYGPRMIVPPPYFGSAVSSGHPPHPFMWGPMQHMMPPYAAMYPHGGVYAHPGVTVAATPVHSDSPAKSSGNLDRGLIKKLKGFNGLEMSIGNGNGGGAENGLSDSGETEGSSEGSDGNTAEGAKNGRKRSHGGSSTTSEVGKSEQHKKVTGVTVTPRKMAISSDSGTELELKKSPAAANMTMVPGTVMLQVHSNERELKRERRKQSNRESARRSRLRKQAESEELATTVESLIKENLELKSDLNQLTVNSANLKLQNAKLLEKLKKSQLNESPEEPSSDKKDLSLSTANLLSRVNNGAGSGVGEATSSGSGAPLRQLLDASPRADAVAAG